MTMDNKISNAAGKSRYMLLDGLRGVAAFMVVWYHVFEGFATSPVDQKFNHGYLAVDFFFMLSGFVIGYAYDDRWSKGLTAGEFFRRRLIRLHPMLVLGILIGVVAFFVQGSVMWDGTEVSGRMVFLSAALMLAFIPATPGCVYEVRGNGEMFPLNGPAWSLFFEYIGNILYALLLHRLSVRGLAYVVALSGAGLAAFALCDLSGFGHIGVGWSLGEYNFLGGMLRLTFSFSAGLLMSRVFRPLRIKGAFWICSAFIVLLLSMPYIGDGSQPWANALFDIGCVIVVFPVLVYIGASGEVVGMTHSLCRFCGELSYPLYIVHYPLMYLFYAWVWGEGLSFAQAWPMAAGVFAGSILLAYMALKYYDEPVRRRLTERVRRRKSRIPVRSEAV